jgi:pimeloyl-ACP methyl ester carboxylesterase
MELQRANDVGSGPAIVFLPGIIMPAEFRYPSLIRELGSGVRAFTKELEVYDARRPREGYTIDLEVKGLARAADTAGLDRFFAYGHSGGGAVSLAFAAAYPQRLLGLGLDEPASDYSEGTKAAWAGTFDPIKALQASERMPAFMRAQVAPGVELPAPPPGAQPEWMASRPAGVEAFIEAIDSYVLAGPPSAFAGPVYYSFGTLTNPIWRDMRARLASAFPNFTSEEYDGLHHLNTSHAAEPARVAAALRRVWNL